MGWNDVEAATSEEGQERAKKQAAMAKEAEVALAKAYNRCFNSEDGKRVLADLTQRMIYNNDTPINSPNVNYEAAYKNGEAGVVKFIIQQMQRAEII